MRNAFRLAVVLSLLSSTSGAFAQSNKVAAEALFEEGRRLMASNHPAEACPKFEASQHLDPSAATLLNLGNCYEKSGRKASAWATYKEAASVANSTRRPELVSVAQKRAAALEARLSTLTITVPSRDDSVEVRRDGTVLAPGAYGVPIPVDAGSHLVEVRAPKKKPWSTTIEVKDEDDKRAITVPPLEDAPEPPPTAGSSEATTSRGPEAVTTPVVVSPGAAAGAPSDDLGQGMRMGAWAALGVGVVGAGLGVAFSVAAKGKYNDSLSECARDHNLCSARGVDLRDDARKLGDVATVAVAVAGVAIATGVVLHLVAPSPSRHTRMALAPTMDGLLLAGQW